VEKYFKEGQATRWQYGTCALHARYIVLQTHTHNM